MEKQDRDCRHHEQKRHTQIAFSRDVKALSTTMEGMGNPFTEESSDLLVLDSRNIVDTAVADTVQQIEQLGLKLYEAYVDERLVNQKIPIYDTIKRNNLHLFSRPPVKGKSSKQQQISSLKNNCSLFSRLYIASFLMVLRLSTCCHLVLLKPSRTMQLIFFCHISHHSFSTWPG